MKCCRRISVCWTLPALLLTLAACSSTPADESDDAQRDGVISAGQYQREYDETVANFPERLPEGFEFVESPPRIDGEIASSLGTASAYFQWYCAWADIYLTTPDDSDKNVAMEELRKYPTTDWAVKHFEDPDGVWEQMLDAAELGDPSELKSMSSSDCEVFTG